jgi:hypothetical protein
MTSHILIIYLPTLLELVINSVTSVIMLVLALIIWKGKGDKLIAGYNTASEQERAKYDVKRLRQVIAACLFAITILLWIPVICRALTGKAKAIVYIIWSLLILVVVIATLILANTWAKKKK